MKKYVAFLLVIILLLSSFVGCENNDQNKDDKPAHTSSEQNKEYKTAIIGYSDGALGINRWSVEYEIRDYEGFKNKKGPKNAVWKVLGEEKILDLSDREGKFYRDNYYPVYEYGNAWFNPDGIMESYLFPNAFTISEDGTCSEEEAVQIAKNFMNGVVNVNEYTISTYKNEERQWYTIYFCKYVDGIRTTEKAEVTVTFDGKLRSYIADMMGQFSTDTKNPFDMDDVEKALNKTIFDQTIDDYMVVFRMHRNMEKMLDSPYYGKIKIKAS